MRSHVRAVLALLLLSMLAPGAILASDPAVEPLNSFPRSSLTVRGATDTHQFQVWLAQTGARRAQGLMFVKELPRGTGMLFTYPQSQPIGMWMKNTLIPLDMLFIAANGRITRIARNTQPHSLQTISSMGPVLGVLEIAGGESERLGIEVGDRVVHPAFR